MLPQFNKGIRKFTRVFRSVFEREIAEEIDKQAASVKHLKTSGIKESLHDELNEGESKLTKKMKEEKAEFIKKF